MYKKIARDLSSNQKRYALYIVAGVIILCILLYIFKARPDDDRKTGNRWRVHAIEALQTSAKPELKLYGTIINPFTSRLKSTIETYVDKVHIREGLFVTKDEILVELDRSEISLEVIQKKAIVDEIKAKLELEAEKYTFDKKTLAAEKKQLELTEQQLERQTALRKQKLNSQLNLDEAAIELQKSKINYYQRELEIESYEHRIAELKAKLAQAESDYGRSLLDLERTKIKAPFNGYISKLFVSPGTRIAPNETILEIFNQDTIEVRAQIPQATMTTIQSIIKDQSEVNKIKASTIILNEKYDLHFRNLTANQDVSSAGTDAFFIFQDKKSKNEIRTIGKTITITLQMPELSNIYLVPSTSIYHGDRLYIIKDNKLKSVVVSIYGEITKNNNDYIIIQPEKNNTTTINPGDKILASLLPSAIDGLAVEIIK